MDNLTLAIDDGVALLTLDDPKRRNALTRQTAEALIASVDRIESDTTVKALVVTGSDPAFCSGADLADLVAATTGDTTGVGLVYEAFGRIADCTLPTIAAVNGPAVGAGMNLALACDIRLVGASARFESRFLSIGIHPGGGHAWMLERLAGSQTAAAMLLLGRPVPASKAVDCGLAWQAYPDDELLDEARELARYVTSVPRDLLRLTKDTLRSTPQLESRASAVSIEAERQLKSLTEPAASELLASLRAQISSKNTRS